jgi:hypothetical protein
MPSFSSSRSSLASIFFPPGIHRELVVRDDDVCPPLSPAEVVQHHYRNLSEAQLAGSQEATVAGNNPIHRVDEDRIGETELSDGRSNLRYLSLRMSARIVREGNEPVNGPDLDGHHLRDRITEVRQIPSLAELIRQRTKELPLGASLGPFLKAPEILRRYSN